MISGQPRTTYLLRSTWDDNSAAPRLWLWSAERWAVQSVMVCGLSQTSDVPANWLSGILR